MGIQIRGKLKKAKEVYRTKGFFFLSRFIAGKFKSKFKSGLLYIRNYKRTSKPFISIPKYDAWLRYNQWNNVSEEALQYRLSKINSSPLISVIMPVYNSPVKFLEEAIQSVCNQIYTNWELCIADDKSTNKEVTALLQSWEKKESRIKVTYRETNGNISSATNSAVAISSGGFLVFLDHDDLFTPNALAEVVLCLSDSMGEVDFIYSDEDKISEEGKLYDPHFKPDWSPELLLSYMYIGHIWGVKKSIYEKVGGMRVGFEGAQDYDFALRATEHCKCIKHIPLVLYHWRAIAGSTALSGSEKPASFEMGRIAVQETLDRRNIKASVNQPGWALERGLGLFVHKFPDEGPLVTIIIATKNKLDYLKKCIDSIKKTSYKNYNVLVIDNESDDPATINYLEQLTHKVVKVKSPHGKFSFSFIHNYVVRDFVSADYILFLNNDIEVISPDWLSQMVGYMLIKDVGIVGAKLIYPDSRIQHAGVIQGLHHGLAGHAFKLLPSEMYGYGCYTKVVRNYSAVTAACMLTSRELFLSSGGFDEEYFAVAYNDVDYSYKVLNKNKRVVFCPEAELIHYEGKSRGFLDNPFETAMFKKKYSSMRDSFYNPNLSLENEQFEINIKKALTSYEKENPIKLLVCTHLLNYTGAPLHQAEIVVKLKKDNKIDPVVLSFEDGPLRAFYEEQNIKVIILPLITFRYIFSEHFEHGLRDLFEKVSSYGDFDLIYANTLQSFPLVLASKKLNIPCVWNIHESVLQNYLLGHQNIVKNNLTKCFSVPYKIVFVAESSKQAYQNYNSVHNFIAIHNGLHYERIISQSKRMTKEVARDLLEIDKEDFVLLTLGTVCERKGQLDLICAIAKLNGDLQKKVKIFVVGDRSSKYSQNLHQQIAQLPASLRNRISVVQETNDVIKYYLAADIFILTSREESYPRVILEAMAFGLPIIATPVFGVKEQIKDGINGFFYEPGNYAALAKYITALMEDSVLRNRFGSNSLQVLSALTNFDEMTEQYYNIFIEATYTKRNAQTIIEKR